MSKSTTDIHWNERAICEKETTAVNIADVSQRELETLFLIKHLGASDRVLEVGCGNGYLTSILRRHVAHVDAFDYAENMISQAILTFGEENNRFFHDNLLVPASWSRQYDTIVCVRVLINLRNFDEQQIAIENMRKALKIGGRLLLIEGYSDGFDELNRVRESSGIVPFKPASINYYCSLDEMQALIKKNFVVEGEFHTGCFDFLTRVVYPALVGAENATGHSEFHKKILPIAQSYNPDQFKSMARLHGFVLIRNS